MIVIFDFQVHKHVPEFTFHQVRLTRNKKKKKKDKKYGEQKTIFFRAALNIAKIRWLEKKSYNDVQTIFKMSDDSATIGLSLS